MKIGLDIDNVILDTDEELLKEMLEYDKKMRNNGIINQTAPYILSGMFDWSKEEIDTFLNKNMERIANNLKPKAKAKYYMDKLLEAGHELYLISNRRARQYQDAYTTTKNNLKSNDINYTKLIITETNDKTKECIDNQIDIIFDDRPSNCFKLLDKGINCCLFKTKYETRTFTTLDSVSNWDELYQKIIQNQQ